MRARLLAVPTILALACEPGDPAGRGAGEACASAAECRRGLACFSGACATAALAAPSCAAPRIAAGDPVQLPEPADGICIQPEPLATAGLVDLGAHRVGGQLTLEVPPGTASLSIFSQEVGGSAVDTIRFQGVPIPNTVVPTDVLLPGGALFFSDTDPYPVDAGGYADVTGVLAYYAGFTPVSGTFTVPNTSAGLDLVRAAGELPPGTWTFTVNDWALECGVVAGCTGASDAGTYQVHAFARPGAVAAAGLLDLEVYLATDPAGPLPDAATAAAHPQVARWARALSALFANAGICLGAVTFHDLPAWAKERFAPRGTVNLDLTGGAPGCDVLSQLFTVGVVPSRAVHLFLAEELVDASTAAFGTTLGVDGSIPGPSGIPGTIHGGAIVGLLDFLGFESSPGACSAPPPTVACGSDALAYIVAHEAGHWLGLYHTTEAHGTAFDPLRDTGTCACASCAGPAERPFCAESGTPDPAPIDASACDGEEGPLAAAMARAVPAAACQGAENLMFWQFDPSRARGKLSPEQGEVMRLNPAVREATP